MSIVENAIEKSRAEQRARPQARTTAKDAADRAAGRTKQAATIDPAQRLRPTMAMLNEVQCRERRLLLRGSEDDDGAAVAAYRMLRTRLLHRARSKGWTSIAVTSADQNDGKTLTALNLAISMSREKSREIVLLDMDMRNPSVFRTLGVTPPRELRDYLEGTDKDSSANDVRELFVSVSSDNLFVAGSTIPTDQASELLHSTRFDDLMHFIKQGTVDPVILLDLPPVLLTDDALVVAPKVDAILVVASEGLTARADLARALELLAEFPVAGVALNRAADTTPGYDYGYEYDEDKGKKG
jgi:protein-tyrosine kinase